MLNISVLSGLAPPTNMDSNKSPTIFLQAGLEVAPDFILCVSYLEISLTNGLICFLNSSLKVETETPKLKVTLKLCQFRLKIYQIRLKTLSVIGTQGGFFFSTRRPEESSLNKTCCDGGRPLWLTIKPVVKKKQNSYDP